MPKQDIDASKLTTSHLGKYVGISHQFKIGDAPVQSKVAGIIKSVRHDLNDDNQMRTDVTFDLGIAELTLPFAGHTLVVGDTITEVTE